MEVDMMQLIKEVSDVQGMHCNFFSAPYENIDELDLGFRKKWYLSEPYSHAVSMIEGMEGGKLYCIEDQFLARYIGFKVPLQERLKTEAGEASEYCMIGPYIPAQWESIFNAVWEERGLTQMQVEAVHHYLESLPTLVDEESKVAVMAKLLQYSGNYEEPVYIVHWSTDQNEVHHELRSDMADTEEYNVQEVADRYAMEASMMDAIAEGDYEKALKMWPEFRSYKVKKRYFGTIHTSKMAMLTFNTLCRVAVQRAAVHPVHIDELSSSIACRIEGCTNVSEILKLNTVMIRKYCLLVRNHSLKGYSLLVRETVNYIDLNLTEPLSLSYLSQKFSVDGKTLTTQFSRETGMRLTEYINNKRVRASLKYLVASDLTIQAIAEKVGFMDDNYYARVFRRIMNMPPSEYRRMVIEGIV